MKRVFVAVATFLVVFAPICHVDYPICVEEDCSDQPNQVGLWLDTDTGNWWLCLGVESVMV